MAHTLYYTLYGLNTASNDLSRLWRPIQQTVKRISRCETKQGDLPAVAFRGSAGTPASGLRASVWGAPASPGSSAGAEATLDPSESMLCFCYTFSFAWPDKKDKK